MTAISEDLQKTFDKAAYQLLQARAAYIRMIEVEKKNEEAMIAGKADDLSAYEAQERGFETALGKVIEQVYEIYTYYTEPQNHDEGIYALLNLLNKAF